MEKYLSSCNTVGQPLRYAGDPGTCMTDNSMFCAPGSFQERFCPGNPPCKACDDTDPCNVNYREARCTMTMPGMPGMVDDLSYDGCQATCTLQSISDQITYFTWDKSGEECYCFNGGHRNCQLQLVKYGFAMDEIVECKYSHYKVFMIFFTQPSSFAGKG